MKAILRIIKLSPILAVKKVFRKIIDKFDNSLKFKKDSHNLTFSPNSSSIQSIHHHIFPLPELEHLRHFVEQLRSSAALSASHQFDLLGSGIVKVFHGMQADGVLGVKYPPVNTFSSTSKYIESIANEENRNYSKKLAELLDDSYELIDWQIDFKSGFRWSHNTWSKKISYGKDIGADIKVPWELGRMQHLISLSLAYYSIKSSKEESKAQHYAKEFTNQIIDFRLSNPPRFGTQWMSCMDMAIRAVNILISYSFFKQAGCNFESRFEAIFLEMLLEHYEFIAGNLEWSSGMRGNHYLAGVSSLIILSAYLPTNEKTDSILLDSLNKLLVESDYQFNQDGSNFEASVSYHRFSLEMLLFGLFAALSLPKSRMGKFKEIKSKCINIRDDGTVELSDNLLNKLFKMIYFLLFSSTKSQYLPQFGDSDSGFFVHLTPFYMKNVSKKLIQKDYFYHSANNPWNIVSLFAGYFSDFIDNPLLKRYNEFHCGKLLRSKSNVDFNLSLASALSAEINRYLQNKFSSEYYPAKSFPDFGLYSVWRKKYHLLFNLGKIGQKGKGGHNHNDILSYELYKGDVPIIVNGGTFCYTSFPELRNKFRSVFNHNTLSIDGKEQNQWGVESKDDLFWLDGDKAKPRMIKFSDTGLIAEHSAYSQKHIRRIVFDDDTIRFSDECNIEGIKKILVHFVPGANISLSDEMALIDYKNIRLKIEKGDFDFKVQPYYYSSHYGLMQNAEMLIIESENAMIEWSIKIY